MYSYKDINFLIFRKEEMDLIIQNMKIVQVSSQEKTIAKGGLLMLMAKEWVRGGQLLPPPGKVITSPSDKRDWRAGCRPGAGRGGGVF